MRILFFVLFIWAFSTPAVSLAGPEQNSPWSLISVPRDRVSSHFLDLLPVMVEGGTQERLHAEAKMQEIHTLREWGVDVEILVADMAQIRPISSTISSPWLMNSWGNQYHDVDQIEASLRLLVESYPQFTRLVQIGASVEGRPILGVVLTDKPWTRDLDEPALRVIGGHHGDEWASTEVALATAWHFAEGYESNASIRALLDGTELWIIPVVNPDGMAEFTRNNSNNVDLNRNYSFAWQNREYSGSAPFSEPETTAIRLWGMARVFYHSLSLHSGAANIGWVWNHTTELCPDNEWMEMVSTHYLEATTFPDFWITNGADWYIVYGESNDWSYGERGGHDYTLELSVNKNPPESGLPSLMAHHIPAIENFFAVDGVRGVRGRIVDDAGNGVEAKISLAGEGAYSYSDFETGAYHRLVTAGSHLFKVEAHGFETQFFQSEVNSEGLSLLNFSLTTTAELDGFSVSGREQLLDAPGDVSICGVEGDTLSWGVYRASYGFVDMGELRKEGLCWIGQWQPELIVEEWERQGEWSLIIANETGEVVARSASGLIAKASFDNADWLVHVEIPGLIPESLSTEAEDSLRRIVVKGSDVPVGAMLRLVHLQGKRVIPLFQEIDENGNSSWLVDISLMEEGLWSIRFLGAGRWTAFPNALLLRAGELESRKWVSRPEIDLELEFLNSTGETEIEESNVRQQSCDCAGLEPSFMGWWFVWALGARRRRRITQ